MPNFTATISNQTPPEWEVTIFAYVIRYINSDGSQGQLTAGNIDLRSGESHTINHSGKCIVGFNEAILVRYDGMVEEFSDNTVVPEGQCAESVDTVLAPTAAASEYQWSVARKLGLAGLIEVQKR